MNIALQIISIDENGYHVMARGTINGLTANILIDTGATRTVLDVNRTRHYFDDAPLEHFGKLFTGVGIEKLTTQSLVIDSLCIGNFEIRDMQVVVIDLGGVNSTYAAYDLPRIDMVLGGDILVRCGGIIDYPGKTLVLTGPY